MCVEERLDLDMLEEEEEICADEIIVGGGLIPMWAGTVRMSGEEVVSASAGSISAVYEKWNFTEDESEHDMTKNLPIKHTWDKYGDK